MFEEFDKIFGRMPPSLFGGRAGPLWCGYHVTVGPDGRPVVREFGNMPRQGERRIQVDTIADEQKNELRLVAEIPGVEKSAIGISVEEDHILIEADRDQTKYRAQVPLDNRVDRESVQASYKNGILEIVCGIDKPKGKTVRVQ